ncbi:CD48 antigen-like [Pogoniulus pusillus]|uniref:CD48 antigen-like n=1 Tax=Pogoniulus pusillus TaxID=488313 RepID=UPI0030B9A07F
MAAESAVLLLLFLLCFVRAWAEQRQAEVVGAVHGEALLSSSLQNALSVHQVHWRRNHSLKVASRDSSRRVQYPNSPYRGRLQLLPNDSLRISDLRRSDSSTYQVYLEDEMGQEYVESILLTVYDQVPKPSVRAKVINDNPELCQATLECEVELEGVTYEWILPSKLQLAAQGGARQQVAFNPSVETYTCRVSNPVSSNSATLTYHHPCSWAGESSAAAPCTTTSLLLALAHLLLLLLLLTAA